MQNLSPKRQTLQHVRVLLRVVMTEPRTTLAASNRQAIFRIFCLRGVKVRFEVTNHAVTRITIRPQEGVVISKAVETLTDLFLVQTLALIARRKRLDRTLLALDILLNLASRSTICVDFLRRNGYKIITKEVQGAVLLQYTVHGSDGFDTGKTEHVLHLERLAVLQFKHSTRGISSNACAYLKEIDQLSIRRAHFVGIHNLVPPSELEYLLVKFGITLEITT